MNMTTRNGTSVQVSDTMYVFEFVIRRRGYFAMHTSSLDAYVRENGRFYARLRSRDIVITKSTYEDHYILRYK